MFEIKESGRLYNLLDDENAENSVLSVKKEVDDKISKMENKLTTSVHKSTGITWIYQG